MNELVLDYLKRYPDFRERHNKAKWIGGIVFKKYGIPLDQKTRDMLADIVTDIQNADRYWRMHTSEHEELRGLDYSTKQEVEESAILSLGYQPGHTQVQKDLTKALTIDEKFDALTK